MRHNTQKAWGMAHRSGWSLRQILFDRLGLKQNLSIKLSDNDEDPNETPRALLSNPMTPKPVLKLRPTLAQT